MKKNKYIKAPRMGKGRKIGIIFVLVALLPALFYSVYEVSSLSSTEELIQSIYSKQLDVILFSINQYALDVAQSWSGEINTLLITSQPSYVDSATRIFLNKRAAVHGVFYTDSTGHSLSFVTRQKKEVRRISQFLLCRTNRRPSKNYYAMHHPAIGKSNLSSSGTVFQVRV
jgi:hypothetical protein